MEINANFETAVQIQVSTTIVIHRTLTWQKLMTLGPSDFSSVIQQHYKLFTTNRPEKNKENNKEKDMEGTNGIGTNASIENTPPTGVTALCWSPDGRFIAIGMADGSTIIYDVETCANPTSPPLPMHCIPPPNLKPDDLPSQEKQEDESWKYCSYSLDRSSFFLPPNTCNSRNVITLITPINTALTAKHPSIYCVLQHALMDYTSTYMDNIAYSVFPHRFLCLTLTHQ